MTGRRGNPLVLRKILPNPDLVIASTGADIGFYIVSLVGQVIFERMIFNCFIINRTVHENIWTNERLVMHNG